MSLKSQVKEIIENESPEEFNNLILDSLKIEQLTAEDQKFLQEFSQLEMLALNQTQLRSLENLPGCKNLLRLEVNDNKLTGAELAHLAQFKTLVVFKCANNQIKTIDELAPLKDLPALKNLDLSSNPIAEVDGYKDKIFKLLPNLQVLDGCDKSGEEIISDDEGYDEEDYGGEQGIPELTQEQIEELKKRGITPEEYYASLQAEEAEEDYGEEGEADIYGDEEGEIELEEYGEENSDGNGDGAVIGKRQADDNGDKDDGDANKRAKEE